MRMSEDMYFETVRHTGHKVCILRLHKAHMSEDMYFETSLGTHVRRYVF